MIVGAVCEARVRNNRRMIVVILVTGMTYLAAGADEPRPPKELEKLWSNLGTDDPAKARQAITALVAKPDTVVPFFQKRLRPVPRPGPSRLARLIADLDNDRFKVRESATQELEQVGELAEAALRKALTGQPPPEVRRRIDRVLLANKRQRLHPPPDQLRLERAVEVLEQIGDRAARQLLATLARGAPEAPLTRDAEGALQRLVERPAASP